MNNKGLPQVAVSHRRARPALSTRVGVALSLFLLYELCRPIQLASRFKAWSHSRPGSHDDHIARVEDAFLAIPSAESAIANSRHFGTHPHLASTPEDFQDAKDVLSVFQDEFAIPPPLVQPIFDAGSPESREATLGATSRLRSPDAWIDVYYPIMNTGNADGISLEILGQDGRSVWTADLLEDGDPSDETAAKYKHAVPPWHGFSAAGEAVGPLVYANYGTKEDYDQLDVMGVNLTGKIVLARYGGSYRGLKIIGAEDRGAAGVLMYTDPRDDGAVVPENGYLPYPAGPARNPTSIQRGSVQFLSIYPGDPSTPGYPAYENASRIEGGNIPHIPSLPLSWANAKYLFEQEFGGVTEGRKLDGKVGSHLVRMVNDVDIKVMPIWNTMAAIPGHIKNEVVILGCHRDAWVMGATDPISGTVSLLEVIRGLGVLVKRGWKPLRTLIIASWDAEEYGLVGSTEWGEDFAQWIQDHVVSYVNVDMSVSGSRYSAWGSPSLAHLIKRSAQDVPHPTDPKRTVWDALYDSGPFDGEQDAEFVGAWTALNQTRSRAAAEDDARNVLPLGSGSDYTVFLQRLGVASSDQTFAATPTDPAYHYHSVYDSQMWQEIYGDPGFHRHVALAKSLGLLTLRLSDSIITPLNTTEYALRLDSYVDIVEKSASGVSTIPDLYILRKAISKLQQASMRLDVEKIEAEKAFHEAMRRFRRGHCLVHDIIDWFMRHFSVGSLPKGENTELTLPALDMLNTMEHVGQDLCVSRKTPLCNLTRAASRVKKVNEKLRSFERGFISEEGVKGREWYRHLGVAPGKYLGYGATTLPALTEAILYENNATLVEYEITRLTNLLTKLADNIEP